MSSGRGQALEVRDGAAHPEKWRTNSTQRTVACGGRPGSEGPECKRMSINIHILHQSVADLLAM